MARIAVIPEPESPPSRYSTHLKDMPVYLLFPGYGPIHEHFRKHIKQNSFYRDLSERPGRNPVYHAVRNVSFVHPGIAALALNDPLTDFLEQAEYGKQVEVPDFATAVSWVAEHHGFTIAYGIPKRTLEKFRGRVESIDVTPLFGLIRLMAYFQDGKRTSIEQDFLQTLTDYCRKGWDVIGNE